MSTDFATARELDSFRDEADRFIAELRRGGLPSLRRSQADLRGRGDLRAPRRALTTRDRAAAARGAGRAAQVRLRGLPREPDATSSGADRHRRRVARGHDRRPDLPLPHVAGRSVERARPRPARANRARAPAPARRASESGVSRGCADRPRSRRPARRAERVRALPGLRLPPATNSPTGAASCWTRPSGCGSARPTGSSATGSASRSARRGRGMWRACSGRRNSISSSRRIRWCPRSTRR